MYECSGVEETGGEKGGRKEGKKGVREKLERMSNKKRGSKQGIRYEVGGRKERRMRGRKEVLSQ